MSDMVKINTPSQEATLAEGMRDHYERGRFIDVVVTCDNDEDRGFRIPSIQCHSVVLSAFSPFLGDLLACETETETETETTGCSGLIFSQVKYWELKALIDFMYYGKIEVEWYCLSQLLGTAKRLKIKGINPLASINWIPRNRTNPVLVPKREPARQSSELTTSEVNRRFNQRTASGSNTGGYTDVHNQQTGWPFGAYNSTQYFRPSMNSGASGGNAGVTINHVEGNARCGIAVVGTDSSIYRCNSRDFSGAGRAHDSVCHQMTSPWPCPQVADKKWPVPLKRKFPMEVATTSHDTHMYGHVDIDRHIDRKPYFVEEQGQEMEAAQSNYHSACFQGPSYAALPLPQQSNIADIKVNTGRMAQALPVPAGKRRWNTQAEKEDWHQRMIQAMVYYCSGESPSVRVAAEKYGVSRHTLRNRIPSKRARTDYECNVTTTT